MIIKDYLIKNNKSNVSINNEDSTNRKNYGLKKTSGLTTYNQLKIINEEIVSRLSQKKSKLKKISKSNLDKTLTSNKSFELESEKKIISNFNDSFSNNFLNAVKF